MFWYVFILHLCNHSCTTNKESLNSQCGLIDSAALCNITLPLNIISPQCNYIHSRLTLSLNAAACSFFGCKNLTFYCWVVKKYFLFYGLHKWLQCINTHVPSSVQHAAQSDLFFFSSSLCSHPFHWLDGQITPDRPELSCGAASVCVAHCTKEQGHTGSSSARQAARCLLRLPRGFTGPEVRLPSMKARLDPNWMLINSTRTS